MKNEENIWSSILEEVRISEKTKLPSCKNILLLGDNESGKTTLVAKLQGNEDPKKGCGLEYSFIDVRDDYRDDHTRLSVWVLDGNPLLSNLLQFSLNEKTFMHTLVMFVVSFTQPWSIMNSLHNWASLLQDHIDTLNLSVDIVKDNQDKNVKKWQDYIEPRNEMDTGMTSLKRSSILEDEEMIFPLDDNILTRNLGMDVIVVLSKSDYMSTLETQLDYKEEHFDFIQQSVRRFCLQYGAALCYTSVKEDKNCDLLYKYLVHRIYGLPFNTPALIVEKDAVFIPSGWDNEKKINILCENLISFKVDDYYTDVISRPSSRKSLAREIEVQAEDNQSFLFRQHQILQQSMSNNALPGGCRQESAARNSSAFAVQKTPERRVGSPSVQLNASKKIDGNKPIVAGVTASEGVLANFFNSLLNKKSNSGGANILKTSTDNVIKSDVAAEFERLTRNKRISSASSCLDQP